VITVLIVAVLALGLIPVCNTIANCFLLRRPLPSGADRSVSILIPARNEERTIAASVDAALASYGVTIEVIVLDDGSTDATAAIVAARARHDPRLRLETAPPLPPGWKGKPHACHVLASLARYDHLLFVDADVTLAPDAAASLVACDADLVSGVPRQRVVGLVESAVVPMINTLIYGYLPVGLMRSRSADVALTAACGQLMMIKASSYRACGGHESVAMAMHDGLQLARHVRRSGFTTDLVDATALAHCRMYETASQVWNGFSKNATEGMAKPVALPVWSMLLIGGWLLPLGLVIAGLLGAAVPLFPLLVGLVVLQAGVRIAQAVKCREPLRALLLHPLGVVLTLAIQWTALIDYYRGRTVEWRGRAYQPTTR
jgi:GT2 family glycosyltransferase